MKSMFSMPITRFLIIAGLSISASAVAQSNDPELDSPYFQELLSVEECDFFKDDSDLASQETLAIAKCEYAVARVLAETKKVNHSIKLYDLQYAATLISTVFVHLALLIGLITATIEFRSAFRMRRREDPLEPHELSVSMEGIALKTTLVGFLILGASLVFYVLYLRTVYPIF